MVNNEIKVYISNKHKSNYIIQSIILRIKYAYFSNNRILKWLTLKKLIFNKKEMIFEGKNSRLNKFLISEGNKVPLNLPFNLSNTQKIIIETENIGIFLSSFTKNLQNGQVIYKKPYKFQIWIENNHGNKFSLIKRLGIPIWIGFYPKNCKKTQIKF
ncbi:MAG: hypothetical protein K9W44_16340 [Candidatus Lokiarchaeota archaeon]|nr:hypothetical protein [Candidatus Harpocratesius repetitus]